MEDHDLALVPLTAAFFLMTLAVVMFQLIRRTPIEALQEEVWGKGRGIFTRTEWYTGYIL